MGLSISMCFFTNSSADERQQLYLMTLEKMRAIGDSNQRVHEELSRIDVDLDAEMQYRGKLKPFWRTRIMPDRWLAENGSWLLPSSDPIFDLLEKETGRSFKNFPRTMILSDTVSTVRLLGGWKSAWKGGEVLPNTSIQDYDLAYRDEAGDLKYRWELLHKRFDPIVENGLTPFVVLDNVPYCFTDSDGNAGYGQNLAPTDYEGWGIFIEDLCRELMNSYGFEKVNSWRFRIGTEMDNPNHWENGADDSLEKYLRTYDIATAAVKKVLPEAKVGPCNFNSMFAGQINRKVPPMEVFEHFADGKNYATGEKGSPVDFVAISSYGMYWMGGKFDHPDAAAHGYSPDVLRLHVDLLKRLRACSPRFKEISLEIQEHGTLFNKDEKISPEPGAFGAAWIAAQYAIGLDQGVSQIFHWQDSERIRGKVILFGHTWVRVMLEKIRGGQIWMPKIANASEGSFINAFAVKKDDALYLVVSCYNAEREDCSDEQLKVSIPSIEGAQIRQCQLSVATSPFDVMHRDLLDNGHAQGSVSTLRAMSDSDGTAQVTANADKYVQLQQASFVWKPFDGSVDAKQKAPELLLSVPTPSVTVLEIKAQ